MSLIDIEIDGLTRSIVEIGTNESLSTTIVWWDQLKPSQKRLTKWDFDWKSEVKMGRKVAALTIRGDRKVQGLISFTAESDHVLVQLVESAPHNIGRRKKFEGVPGNLFAFACREAFRLGFEGSLSFFAKTDLIAHYETTLGAVRLGTSRRMIIETEPARLLVNTYFEETDQWPS